jgi:hypothetical protein
LKLLEKFPDKKWDWSAISCNPNITIEDINNNPDKPWDWYNISKNKFNTHEVVQKRINDHIENRHNSFNIINLFMIKDISYICCMYL